MESTSTIITILISSISLIFGIMTWILKNRDDQQQRDIDLLRVNIREQDKSIDSLYAKHDLDFRELQELKIEIADNFYKKHELDNKFDRVMAAVDKLSLKIDDLSAKILEIKK